jgi:hypothetical protein
MAISGVKGAVSFATGTVSELKSWNVAVASDEVEAGHNAGWKVFVKGLKSASGSFVCTGSHIPSLSDCLVAVSLTMASTDGCAAGDAFDVSISGSAFTTNWQVETPSDGVVQYTCDFRFSGVVTINLNPS